ncbi:MAG: hypothetical protein JXQ91_03245 [Vannielia sp.]|uniref:hypothetical protein n=1 Tax=Rhodobacterales TaxID=204455 RepID=UPI002094AA09|nr:hypothetical protein [Oceanicola sp. 502str15]MCO6382055.1 hypothetical protein [Oceanicola sp. 502str15]
MRLALLAALLLPAPALALGYECSFTRYCVEERSCQPSGLTLHIRPRAEATAPDQWEMETGGAATARVIPVRQIRDPLGDSFSYVSAMEYDTIHLVSIFKRGITRYSMHNSVEGIQSQNFHGTCKVAP